jgi:type I restriction enzyme R subunit
VIRPSNYSAPIDLSDVVLRNVKQVDKGTTDVGLGAHVGLTGMTAAGSGETHDPTMIAFQQVLMQLNDLFGNEDFTETQTASFLRALLEALLADNGLVQQAKVNTAGQFAESPDFEQAVTGAVADNQGAHAKMADYFFTDSPGRGRLIADIATWFYEAAVADGVVAARDA